MRGGGVSLLAGTLGGGSPHRRAGGVKARIVPHGVVRVENSAHILGWGGVELWPTPHSSGRVVMRMLSTLYNFRLVKKTKKNKNNNNPETRAQNNNKQNILYPYPLSSVPFG